MVHNIIAEYYLVEYPGIVKNPLRSLDNLGGVATIAKVILSTLRPKRISCSPNLMPHLLLQRFSEETSELELRFRSGDPFCHPISGKIVESNALLLKLVVKKKKNGSPEVKDIRSTIILGLVVKRCRFRGCAL